MTMADPDARGKARTPRTKDASERLLDRELVDLPPEPRWREWMLCVEAVIFAVAEPVGREILASVVGKDCSIDLLIDDLREELKGRPCDIVFVAGGWQHLTRPGYASAIRDVASVDGRRGDGHSFIASSCRSPLGPAGRGSNRRNNIEAPSNAGRGDGRNGFSPLNDSLGMALARGTRLQPCVIAALEKWLISNARV